MYQSDYVTASFTELMRQAPDTVAVYLRQAKTEIDATFGEGYAAKNPDLVAAFISACSADMSAATLSKVLGNAVQEVSSAINQVVSAIESD